MSGLSGGPNIKNRSSDDFHPHRHMSVQDCALVELGEVLRDRSYRFTTVTPATHARFIEAASRGAQGLRDVFGWSLPFHRSVIPSRIFSLMRDAEVLRPAGEAWRSTVRFSHLNNHLLAHSAYPTTAGDAVFFGPDTYRFCNFIQAFLDAGTAPLGRAVDIGCGSGAGAILIASARAAAEVLAVDINDEALRLTRINAALAGLSNVHPQHSNLLQDVDGEFDLIVANPPYLIDADQRAYRHGGGVLGAELSLAMLDAALPRLALGGTLLLYTGVAMIDGEDPFLREVQKRVHGARMHAHYRELDPDVFGEEIGHGAYAHADRIAAVGLQVTRNARA